MKLGYNTPKIFFPNRKYSPTSRELQTFTFLLNFNIEVGILQFENFLAPNRLCSMQKLIF